ncbi:MAG: adenine phosphoribosyltransferase [Ignavibacteriaceae bacterium]
MKDDIKKYIRNIKDFPKPGIMFRDITTLLKDPVALNRTFSELYRLSEGRKIDKVAAIESRGFIFGAMLAKELNAGFIPIRKPGKLPAKKISESYQLEYGTDAVEIHADSINKGETVLLHDDLLATGGTALAACKLIEKLGGRVEQISFIIELTFLKGKEKLKDYEVHSLIAYEDEN